MELGKLYVTIAADTKRLTAGLAKAKGEIAKTTAGMGAHFKTMGMGMAVAGAAITAAFGLTIKSAISFEAELAQVSTMLNDVSMKYMPEFKSGLQSLAMEFGESTNTLSKGLYDILSASIDPAKALDVLGVASKAATAGITDTGVAADAITTIINSYGLEAEDAGMVSDKLFAIVKRGKCLTGETRILLSDGRYKRIDSLRNEKDLEIVSWDYRNFITTKAKFVDMGTKRIVKIITADGREIRTTPEHPYLTPNGWEKVENLKEGSKIAVPSSLPFFGRIKPKDGWPELLGYLLAEGSIQNSSPRLAIDNPIILNKVKDAAKRYGINVKEVNQKDKTKCGSYMLTSGTRDSKHKNPVIDKLREYDLWGKNCHTKFVPEEIFSWRKEDVAKLLNAYFNGDGWLSKKSVGACSVSEQLIRDVSHLLLRFGINGYIRKTLTNAWTWEAKRYIEIKRFTDFIGIERESVKEFLKYIPQKRGSYKYLTSYGKTPGEKTKHKPYGGIINTDNQLYYIKIKKIIYQDEERVYDLIVPKLHNFVANDILAHNTTFAQLAPAIGTVAATASMAGLSFEDLGASIATITRAGINTNAAMTAINGVLKAFLKPQEKAVIAAKKFGLELDTNTLKTIGLTGVMEKLKDATAEELAAIFGSIRGLKGMAAALGDMKGYLIDYELLMNSAGLTQEAFDKQSATLKFQLGRLKQSFMMLVVTIGEKFIPVMKAISGTLIKVTGAMKKWTDAHPTLTKAIVLLTGALGVLVGAGGAVILATFAFAKMKIALLALKGAFIAVKTALLLFSGPIGWIIAGVIALTAAWLTNFGKIRDFTLAMVGPVKKALGWIIDKFIWVLEKLGLYKKEMESAGGGSADAFVEGAEKVKTAAEDTVGGVDDLADGVDELGDGLEETGEKLDEFGNKIETFDEWVQRLADEAAEANKELADAAEEAYDRYEEAMKPIEDRLYELSHTEEEVAARKLQLEREKMEATIKAAELGTEAEAEALRKVKEVYEAEINIIIAKIEEKKQEEIEAAKTTEETAAVQGRAIDGIKVKWDELISKVDAYGDAIKEAAKIAAEQAYQALPTIGESGYTPDYIPEGEGLKPIESFATGTPYVKKTGFVKVHKGEAIFPEKANPFSRLTSSNIFNNQRSSESKTYSPTVIVNVQGDGNKWEIKSAVKEQLDESAIQFERRGSWVMPGG